MADKKFNIKDQLAGIAALIAAIVAIGGGFAKYGELTQKIKALELANKKQTVVDTSKIESGLAVLEEKVSALESVDTPHTHSFIEHDHKIEHNHTKPLVNAKEIELLKVQIEEIKVATSNPLSQ